MIHALFYFALVFHAAGTIKFIMDVMALIWLWQSGSGEKKTFRELTASRNFFSLCDKKLSASI